MTYRLTTESLDQDVEVSDFPTRDEAIERARRWFIEPYEDGNAGDPNDQHTIEMMEQLVSDLRAGRTFQGCCFYERVSIAEV